MAARKTPGTGHSPSWTRAACERQAAHGNDVGRAGTLGGGRARLDCPGPVRWRRRAFSGSFRDGIFFSGGRESGRKDVGFLNPEVHIDESCFGSAALSVRSRVPVHANARPPAQFFLLESSPAWSRPALRSRDLNERIRRVGRTENVGVAPEECRRLYKISDSVFQPAEFRRASGRVMQCLHALSVTLISRFAIPPLGRSAVLRYA